MASERQEAWTYALARLLEREEQQLVEDLQPLIRRVVAQLGELIEELPASSPSRDLAWQQAQPALEVLLGQVNDELRRELGATLAGLQQPVRAHALTLARGSTDLPVRSGAELLRRVRMSDQAIADWFRRQSPSRWMVGLRDGIDRAVRAGWQRDASAKALAREVGLAARQLITAAIETIARTAVWDAANQEVTAVWGADRRFKYVAILDAKTCPICRPFADQEGTLSELPDPPLHPRCRCVRLPVD
jgi:SPP1 gp7 family putative phage head morphogenesis protein